MSQYDSDSHVSLDNSLYLLPFLAIAFFPEFFIWVLAIFAIVCWAITTIVLLVLFVSGIVTIGREIGYRLGFGYRIGWKGGKAMTKYHWVVAFAALAMLLETGASYPISRSYGLAISIAWLILSPVATMGIAAFLLLGGQKTGTNCPS